MSIDQLRLAAVAALLSSLWLVGHTLGRIPSVEPNYLGIRGHKRLRMQRENPLFASFEPVIRWLGARIQLTLSAAHRAEIERQLVAAGDYMGLMPEEFVALTLLSLSAGLASSIAYVLVFSKNMIFVLIGAILGAVVPYFHVTGIERNRSHYIQKTLPYAVDLLALSLSAGLDFPGAMRQVIEKNGNPDDALIEEFGYVLQELQVGKTRSEALGLFRERVPTDMVRQFVGAVVQAEERGNPLGPVLQIQAEVSRQQRSTAAEIAASKASVRMVGPMVLVFAAVLLLVVSPMVLQLRSSLFAE